MKIDKMLSGATIKKIGLVTALSIGFSVQIYAQSDPALIWTQVSGAWDSDGGFQTIAVDPTDPNIIFVGSSEDYGAGIYESTDGGNTWVAKNTGVPQIWPTSDYLPITKIVISPSNPNLIYFGTATGTSGHIYKSVDGGESWQEADGQQSVLGVYQLNGAIYDFDVSPTDPNTVYAGATGQGVLKTTDGGSDWSVVLPGQSGDGWIDYFNIVRILPTQPNTVFASGFRNYLVDLPGILWEENLETIPDTAGIVPLPLQKSVDGGTTWSSFAIPSQTYIGNFSSLALLTDFQYEQASGNLYVSTIAYKGEGWAVLGEVNGQGILRSGDTGQSWQTVNQASFENLGSIGFVALSSNPSSVNKGIFASTGGLSVGGLVIGTTNSANGWFRLDPCLNAFIGRTAVAGNEFFALTSLGIYRADISSLYAPPTPMVTSVSPQTLPPSSSSQLITINGSNFLQAGDPNASTLLFIDPANNTYTGTPVNVTANSLQYDLNVQSAVGTWTVEVVNGNVASAPFTFTVASINSQLQGISISGPANIFQNTSANQYTATALMSDGTTASVAPTWSLNSGAPASISSSGQLTAYSVSTTTSITITATYTYGNVTKTANYSVKISQLNNGCGTYLTNIIYNGTFASGSNGWTLSGNFQADTRFLTYNNEPGYAYLANPDGSGGNNLSGTLSQTITIPANATTATLSYYYRITTTETGSIGYDFLNLELLNTSSGTVHLGYKSNVDSNSSYAFQSYDVSAYKGQTITVEFYATTDGSNPTIFRVDDVSLICAGPNPVTPVLFGMNGPISVPQNTTAQYNAIVVNCDNSIQSFTPAWSVSSGPASISSSGLLTANNVSVDTTATVTAIYKGNTRIDYPITIVHIAPVYTSLAISGASSILESQSAQFSATELFSDGSGQSVTPTWSVNSSAANISSSGLLTVGTLSGNVTVTVSASFTSSGITQTASQQVTIIYVPPPPTLAALNIIGPNSVDEISSDQFSAAALFSDGSSQVVSPLWNLDSTLANISANGLLSVGDDLQSNALANVSASYTAGGLTCTTTNSITLNFIPPTIGFQFIGSQITVSWLTNYPDFSLEYTTNLTMTNWLPDCVLPVIIGQQFIVTNQISAENIFFQLKE